MSRTILTLTLASCFSLTKAQPALKKNPNFSLNIPFEDTSLNRFWVWGGDGFRIEEQRITMSGTQLNSKTHLRNIFPISQDDYIEINMNLRFELKAGNNASNSTNVFLLQLAPPQTKFEWEYPANMTVLNGLVIAVIGSDNTEFGKYMVSHRFFGQETPLHRNYFSLLADRKDRVEGCELPDLMAITGLTIKLDFEKTHTLDVYLQEGEVSKFCFRVDNPMRYIQAKSTYLTLKTMTGELNSLSISLFDLTFNEKNHSFDIEEELVISHDLVEEIFEKVNSFSVAFNENKDKLKSIYEIQDSVLQEANRLEVYSSDLLSGTKKFQEHMVENLSLNKLATQENFPLMKRIKGKIESLVDRQKKFFDTFVSIKGLLDAKRLLKRSYKRLVNIQEVVTQIESLTKDDKFAQFLNESRTLLEPLSDSLLPDNMEMFRGLTEDAESRKTHYGVGLVIVILTITTLSVFGCLILKKIRDAERSHLA